MLSEAASYKPLAILRIGTGAILLAQGAYLWGYRDVLLYDQGLVPWELGESFIDALMPRLSGIVAVLAPLGISSQVATGLVVAVHLIAALALLLGFATRPSAVVAWLTHLVLIGTRVAYTYRLGKLLVIALFYFLVIAVWPQCSVHS